MKYESTTPKKFDRNNELILKATGTMTNYIYNLKRFSGYNDARTPTEPVFVRGILTKAIEDLKELDE